LIHEDQHLIKLALDISLRHLVSRKAVGLQSLITDLLGFYDTGFTSLETGSHTLIAIGCDDNQSIKDFA
jgi:hypothetical protein